LYPWAPRILLDETSSYTSRESVVALRKSGCHFGKEHDRFLRITPCREDEPVCCDESSNPVGPLCYFYVTIFKKGPFAPPVIYF